MILFTPDGSEITRLPGEVDADQYMRVLAMGMNGARPVKETLAAALGAGGAVANPLTPDDWRMLSFYSWDTDDAQLVAKNDVAATLQAAGEGMPRRSARIGDEARTQGDVAAATAKDAKPRDDRKPPRRSSATCWPIRSSPAPISTSSPETRATSRAT